MQLETYIYECLDRMFQLSDRRRSVLGYCWRGVVSSFLKDRVVERDKMQRHGFKNALKVQERPHGTHFISSKECVGALSTPVHKTLKSTNTFLHFIAFVARLGG